MVQDLSPAQYTLTASVLGAGTVGSQVIRLLTEQTGDFIARSGTRLEITGVAVRDVNVPHNFAVPRDLLTDDAVVVATGNDLVIELIGGIEPARTLILAAFKAGASVITGNKALTAAHDPKPYTAATTTGTDFYYKAVVAGVIPVVYTLRESMASDRVTSVLGIVNGTTNYILDEMSAKGLSFGTTPATAQELGYTGADPAADVDGLDAAAKAAIIISFAFHTRVGLDDVSVEGIREVTADNIREAHASGCELKLFVIAQCRDDEHAQGVPMRIHPALVPNDHPLVNVHGAYDAILVETESTGRLMFHGQGAGEAPTAPAVLSDVVAAAAHRIHGDQAPRKPSYTSLRVLGPGTAITRYQIQLHSNDAVDSLAAMASIFAENEVSINPVRRSAYVTSNGSHDQAVVIFVTHPAPVFHLDAAAEGLQGSNRIAEVVSIQHVEGE